MLIGTGAMLVLSIGHARGHASPVHRACTGEYRTMLVLSSAGRELCPVVRRDWVCHIKTQTCRGSCGEVSCTGVCALVCDTRM